jgi:hypothetical protein
VDKIGSSCFVRFLFWKAPSRLGVSRAILQPTAAGISPLELAQRLAGAIPWSYHQVLFDKVKNLAERAFYMKKTIQNGWSRAVLKLQIQHKLKQFIACSKSGQSCMLHSMQTSDCQRRRNPAPFLEQIWHALQNIHPKSPKAQDYFGYPNRRIDGWLRCLYTDIPGDPV